MTTTETRRDTRPAERKGPGNHVRRGLVLLAGAVALFLLVQPVGFLPYFWLPVVVGVTFVVAAAVNGKQSPFWTAGLVVGAWGVGTVVNNNAGAHAGWTGALPLLLLGAGALVAAYLGSRGFSTDVGAAGRAVVFLGVGQFIHITTDGWITTIFVGLIAAWGLWEIFSPAAARADQRAGARA